MQLQFTAVFEKVPEGYIGFVEELPGANTQGAGLSGCPRTPREACSMKWEAARRSERRVGPGSPGARLPQHQGETLRQ